MAKVRKTLPAGRFVANIFVIIRGEKGAIMKKAEGYKDAVEEIESIVHEIENETIDVDVLSKKVKRAIFLIKLCREKLRKTEDEVKSILKELEKTDETD